MSLNASVTLSIGELDGLRSQIASLKSDIDQYKERERTVTFKVFEKYVEYGPTSYDRFSFPTPKKKDIVIESYKNIEEIMDPLRKKADEEVQESVKKWSKEIYEKNSKIDSLTKKLQEKCEAFDALKANKEYASLEEKLKQLEDQIRQKGDQFIQDKYNMSLSHGNEISELKGKVKHLQSLKWYHLIFKRK